MSGNKEEHSFVDIITCIQYWVVAIKIMQTQVQIFTSNNISMSPRSIHRELLALM